MAKLSEVEATFLQFGEDDAPGTPGAGIVRLYAKADGALYQKDDAGAESALGGGLSNPMTTAEDIIVGGASGTPARLAKGTDDQVLTMVSGAVAWAAPSGGSTFVGASVYKSAEQSNISTGSAQKVTFDSTDYDTDSLFDNANDRLVVPAGMGGKWQLSGGIFLKECPNDQDLIASVRVNATEKIYYFMREQPNDPAKAASFCYVADLDAADYVELYLQAAGAGVDIREGLGATMLQLTKLG